MKNPREERADLVEDGFLDVNRAAEYLGLSRAKVYMLMEAGELAYAKFGRSRRIPQRALRDYASSCLIE